MRGAYDSIKAERGREVTLEAPDFLEQARQLLCRSVPVVIRMSGSSMSPAIEDGDLITIEPLVDSAIKPGEIVLYQSRFDTAVIHRVVRLDRNPDRAVVTRGDAASQNDTPVPLHRILGRVNLVERRGEQIKMDQPRMSLLMRIRSWFQNIRARL